MTHPDWPPARDDAEPGAPDAPLDAALLDAARAYHRPPPTPADAIWAGIQARRAGRAAPAAGAPLGGPPHIAPHVAPPHGGPPFARDDLAVRRLARGGRAVPRWAALAAAAVLLVAAGVGIGRQTAPGGPLPVAPTAAAPSAEAPRATPARHAGARDQRHQSALARSLHESAPDVFQPAPGRGYRRVGVRLRAPAHAPAKRRQ
jgi:hypothetical protein